jgi:tetratricopeptide (TPR) repeat protein
MGCTTFSSVQSFDVPVLEASLDIAVFDGATGSLLQEERLEHVEEGRDWDRMRPIAAERLLAKLVPMLQEHERSERVELLEVDLDPANAAIAHAVEGRWHDARALLERAAASPEMSELDAPDAARLYYDLGLARCFDATTERSLEERFEGARGALRRALDLDPSARYRDALHLVERHFDNARVLREQRSAAEWHARRGGAAPVPEAPGTYGDR